MEDLIRLGAYKPGSDPDTDEAVRLFQSASPFLSQMRGECIPASQSFAEIYRMILEAGIKDPLRGFFEQTKQEQTPKEIITAQ